MTDKGALSFMKWIKCQRTHYFSGRIPVVTSTTAPMSTLMLQPVIGFVWWLPRKTAVLFRPRVVWPAGRGRR